MASTDRARADVWRAVLDRIPTCVGVYEVVRGPDGPVDLRVVDVNAAARRAGAQRPGQLLSACAAPGWVEACLEALDRGGPADRRVDGVALHLEAHDEGLVAFWPGEPEGSSDGMSPEDRADSELRTVCDAINDGVVVFDADGRTVLVNEAEARLFGYPSTDAMAEDAPHFRERFVLSQLDGTPVPFERWPVSRILRGERVVGVELRVHRRDTGAEWIVSFSGGVVRDRAGAVGRVVVISRDVTAERDAQQALRLSEERLRLAAEATGFGTYDFDPATGRATWSERLRRIMGVGGEELVTAPDALASRVHPDDLEAFETGWERAFDPSDPDEHVEEFRIVRDDGGIRWLRDSGRVFFEEVGGARRPVRAVGTVVDITDRVVEALLALPQGPLHPDHVERVVPGPGRRVSCGRTRSPSAAGTGVGAGSSRGRSRSATRRAGWCAGSGPTPTSPISATPSGPSRRPTGARTSSSPPWPASSATRSRRSARRSIC